jgi:hypothetical protein
MSPRRPEVKPGRHTNAYRNPGIVEPCCIGKRRNFLGASIWPQPARLRPAAPPLRLSDLREPGSCVGQALSLTLFRVRLTPGRLGSTSGLNSG